MKTNVLKEMLREVLAGRLKVCSAEMIRVAWQLKKNITGTEHNHLLFL